MVVRPISRALIFSKFNSSWFEFCVHCIIHEHHSPIRLHPRLLNRYVDYLREDIAEFMSSDVPASSMVTGFGEMVVRMYNLKGEEVGPRNGASATTTGAHYSNTDEDGVYVVKKVPAQGDWLLMSLCSAHLEEKHQWGPGVGLEDDIFITNEEWIHYKIGTNFTGISVSI